nr:TonB-dependent receptor [Desulfobulbaceae bacterium]
MKKALLMTAAILLGSYPMVAGAKSNQSAVSPEEISAFEKIFGSGPQEEDVYRADRLLVSATGSQIPVHLAPSVASVISKEDIEEIGATTLDEILETVPGLHVAPSNSAYMSSIWSVRGIHTSVNPQVLLLINGIPLSETITGTRPYLFHMPVAMISRVEVVRGPGSAVHGADAFAGTVNVITKDGIEIDGTKAGMRYGSFNTSDLWLQHGGIYAGWDLYGSVETQKTSGDNNRVVGRDYLDAIGASAFSNTPGHLDTEYDLVTTHWGLRKDNFSLKLYGYWQENAGMGPGATQVITYNSGNDSRGFMGDLEYRDKKFFSDDLDLSLRLYSVYNKSNNFFELTTPTYPAYMLGNPIAETKYTGLETTALYKGLLDHLWRVSLGWKFFDTDTDQFKNFGSGVAVQYGPLVNIKNTPYNFMEDHGRKLWNISVQDEWNFARRWTLTGGVRYDYYDDFGSTTNPRAALVWETRYDLTTKLMYGRAYRAPSFGEQYFQNNAQAKGNPNLKPETIDTYELAFDYQPTTNLSTKLNLFTYTIDGLIEYVADPATPGILQAQNYKDQEGQGFEVEAEWQVAEGLRVSSNYAFQRSKDRQTGELTNDAPSQQLYVNPHWTFANDWSLDSQFYWVAGRRRASGDPRPDIEDYELVNLTLRRTNVLDRVDLALAVRNLFNEDIRESSPYVAGAGAYGAYITNDYPMESRAVWAEVRWSY